MIWTIKISSKGQMVLPKALRDRLVPHQSDLDKPDLAAMGVALVYHNLSDGVLGVKRAQT
jgi:hypothetical protein